MSLDLSRMQEKVRKWTEWTALLNSISSDPDGKEFLSEIFSSNGTTPVSGSVIRSRRRMEKTEKRMNAIWQACLTFPQSFGLRELVDTLQKQNFKFRRGDPTIEIGTALRELIGDKKLSIVRERHGTIGRLYQKLLP